MMVQESQPDKTYAYAEDCTLRRDSRIDNKDNEATVSSIQVDSVANVTFMGKEPKLSRDVENDLFQDNIIKKECRSRSPSPINVDLSLVKEEPITMYEGTADYSLPHSMRIKEEHSSGPSIEVDVELSVKNGELCLMNEDRDKSYEEEEDGNRSDDVKLEIPVKIGLDTTPINKDIRTEDELTNNQPHDISDIYKDFVSKIKPNRNSDKPFVCTICSSTFTLRSSLKVHLRTHTGEKPFVCPYCSRKFPYRTSLNSHVLTHTEEKPFTCQFCNSSFSQKSNLKAHLRTHTGEKPFICAYCPCTFSRKETLSRHLRTHTKEKPFACTLCTRRFTQKTALTRHFRTHTDENPYKCELCLSSFPQKSNLTRHLQMHSGDKPFACHVCQTSFSQKGNLTAHLRTHTKEKPFLCTYCPRKFSRNVTLNVHLRTHTKEKPFVCTLCMRNFSRKSELTEHILSHTDV